MKPSIPALFCIALGVYLLWCAITDRSPIGVAQAVAKGQGVPRPNSWSQGEQLLKKIPSSTSNIPNIPDSGARPPGIVI